MRTTRPRACCRISSARVAGRSTLHHELPRQHHRPARSVHAVRQARALSGRHAGARRRAPLGVYVESVCGGRATCGRCQIEVQEGNFAKHKIVSSNDHISPKGAKEERYERVRGLPEGRRLSCSAHDPRRPRHRRAAGHGDQRADRAQGGDRPRHRAQCRRPALLRRGRRARHAQAARRPRPAEGRAGEGLGLEGPADRAAPASRRCRGSCARATGASPPRSTATWILAPLHHRALARPQERGLRHRLRHRLDHHRHASGVAAVRPHRRLVRHVEPADPLRRGSDEPRLLCDDEPGRPRGDDQGRARGGQRADRQGLRGRQRRPRRHFRLRLRRQSDHAPPVPRHRPDRARPGAVRARRLRRAAVLGA